MYKYVTRQDEIRDYLGISKIIAFDFETAPLEPYREEERAALDAHKAQIVGVSFSVKEGTGIYIPLRHKRGTNVDYPDEVIKYLKQIVFQNAEVIKVAHNLSFEAMFLYSVGIVLKPPVYDTIAAAQLTLKNPKAFRGLADSGLKMLVPELFDEELPGFEEVTGGRHFDELDPGDEETVSYACADSDYTLRLYHIFNDWFERYLPRHRFMVEEIESQTAVYVGLMKFNGLLVDKELMLRKQDEAAERITRLKDEISFVIGDVKIGANASTLAFKKYLFEDLGLPVLKTTAKRKEAADDETMILLTEWCEKNKPELVRLFELVQEYRKWGKLKSTYIDGYLKHVNGTTGRIHPDLLPLATETGRFAARNPNLQNCPRKDNDPVGVRDFIVAHQGKSLLSLDFSQIELRVGAFYCRDKTMLETYRTGGDIHTQTTSVIYRIPFEDAKNKNAQHYKERRSIAKNCNFGVFYGLFPKGLRRNLKFKAGLSTSLSECEKIIRNLRDGYPDLTRWQKSIVAQARSRGYTETWLGRRRYLPSITSEDWGKRSFAERCALNTPIQGTAADILKLALTRIIEGLPERLWLKPLLQIHDELVFEVPEEKLEEAIIIVKACMEERPFEAFDVPIIAEAAVGTSFGNLKELED